MAVEVVGRQQVARAWLRDVADDSVRFAAFVGALALYSVAGSPTPDVLGWPELVVGAVLVYALCFMACGLAVCGVALFSLF